METSYFVHFGLEKGKLMSEFDTVVLPSKNYALYAFAGAERIRHIVFTEGEKDLVIAYGAFSELPDLETIEFQCDVAMIAYDCFCRCPKLHTVKFEQPIGQIIGSFNDNPQLSRLVWPERSEEMDEQSAGGWRQPKPKPLIGTIEGFNGCSKLSPEQIPFEQADAIGGFCRNYHDNVVLTTMMSIKEPKEAGEPATQENTLCSMDQSRRDRVIADSLAYSDRIISGIAQITAKLR